MLLPLALAVACATGPAEDVAAGPSQAFAAAAIESMAIKPAKKSLAPGKKQRFRVRAADRSLVPSASIVYTATGGTITTDESYAHYTAGSTAGSFEVNATIGDRTLTATVTIGGTPPRGGEEGEGEGDGDGETPPSTPPVPVPPVPVPPVPPLSPDGTSCLSQSGPLVTLTGRRARYDTRTTMAPHTKVDARGASWVGIGGFPITVGNKDAPGLCWSGGRIEGTWTASTDWRTYHSSAGMFIESPGFVVEDVTIVNYGDAIRAVDYTDNWTIRRMHVQDAHDDCVENDRLYNGLIDDALFEGCYVFLSSRAGSGVELPVDGTNAVVEIRNTLVWHKPMPTVYRGPTPGTGPLFKWSPTGTKLVIHNSIFRVDQAPNHGDLSIPNVVSCSNNTIVWLGAGPYPVPLPACFKVTTDRSVWDQAVSGWKARHR